MQPEPQPLRGFLLRLIHLHNMEHMKWGFSFNGGSGGGGGGGGIIQSPIGVNDNRG